LKAISQVKFDQWYNMW